MLSQAIEIMLRCDGVIFCDGWRKSRGCRMEHFKARAAGLPRWIGVDAFLGNLRQQNEGYKRFEMLMFEQMIAEGKMRRGHPEDLNGGKCAGRSDEVGGFHDEGLGWSPDGNFCGECSNGTCAACPVAEDELKEAAL